MNLLKETRSMGNTTHTKDITISYFRCQKSTCIGALALPVPTSMQPCELYNLNLLLSCKFKTRHSYTCMNSAIFTSQSNLPFLDPFAPLILSRPKNLICREERKRGCTYVASGDACYRHIVYMLFIHSKNKVEESMLLQRECGICFLFFGYGMFSTVLKLHV